MSANAHVVALDDRPRREQSLEKVGEEVAPCIGRLDQRLDAQAVRISVDDQPRHQIGLAVHQAARSLARGVREGEVAQRDGLREAPDEEFLVDGLVLPGEEADGDLADRSVERLPGEPAALIGEPDDLAAGERVGCGDVRTVDPDVSLRQPLHRSLRKHDRRFVRRRGDAAQDGRLAFRGLARSGTGPRAHVAGSARAVLEPLEAASVPGRARFRHL